MLILFLSGTLLDNITAVVEEIRAADSVLCGVFLAYVFLSALTLTNLMIAVLCHVVDGNSDAEKDRLAVDLVTQKLQSILKRTGGVEDGIITRTEMKQILKDPAAAPALVEVGVDPMSLIDFEEHLFKADVTDEVASCGIPFDTFMQGLLELRGSNTATVKDIVSINNHVSKNISLIEDAISENHREHIFVYSKLAAIMSLPHECVSTPFGTALGEARLKTGLSTQHLPTEHSYASNEYLRPTLLASAPPSVAELKDLQHGGLLRI